MILTLRSYRTFPILLVSAASLLIQVPAALPAEKMNPYGEISGIAVEKATQQPVHSCAVVVMGTAFGTLTDEKGAFSIPGIPAGTYQVKMMSVGYEPLVKTDIVVKPGRSVFVQVELDLRVITGKEVTVTGDYFPKERYASTSAQILNYEEVRRSPGSGEDISRVVQALPGVASTDLSSELLVRGGSPQENLTLLDNIEIFNPNHYPGVGVSGFGASGGGGGAISMLRTEFVQEVEFLAGGFPARYGDKLSSVLDISVRDGNRKEFQADADLSMAGAGGIFEGPLFSSKGSWLVSTRKSYLDLLRESVSLTAVPRYWDVQGKFSLDLAPSLKLSLNGVLGDDKIHFEEDKGDTTSVQEDVGFSSVENAGGATLRYLFSKSGYATFTLSQTSVVPTTEVSFRRRRLYDQKSTESELQGKGELVLRQSSRREIQAGFSVKRVGFSYDIFSSPDTFTVLLEADTARTIYPGLDLRGLEVTSEKFASYIDLKEWLLPNLLIHPGLRFDYFRITGGKELSPRLGLTFRLSDRTSINASYGHFYQSPPYLPFVTVPANRDLRHMKAIHYVAGVEHLLSPDLKFSVELFDKEYSRLLVSEVRGGDRLTNGASGYARGVDFFIQKKLSRKFYGLLSYSRSIARSRDFREGWYDSDYDFRNLFTLISGYKHSNKWEFSARWRYLGGRPYTPIVREKYDPVTGEWVGRAGAINSVRYPAYHKLDLRFDHRGLHKTWNLVTYFEIWNAYNRKNVYGYFWNSRDGAMQTVYQWSFMPVGGVSVEF